MGTAWLKEGGGLMLIYFLFLYPNEGGIGEGLKERGAKYRGGKNILFSGTATKWENFMRVVDTNPV